MKTWIIKLFYRELSQFEIMEFRLIIRDVEFAFAEDNRVQYDPSACKVIPCSAFKRWYETGVEIEEIRIRYSMFHVKNNLNNWNLTHLKKFYSIFEWKKFLELMVLQQDNRCYLTSVTYNSLA